MEHKNGPNIYIDREAVELTPIKNDEALLQSQQKPP
jgi:hypothetical protein